MKLANNTRMPSDASQAGAAERSVRRYRYILVVQAMPA